MSEMTEERAKAIFDRFVNSPSSLPIAEMAGSEEWFEAKGFLLGIAAERKKHVNELAEASWQSIASETQDKLETLRKALSDEIAKNEGLRKELEDFKECWIKDKVWCAKHGGASAYDRECALNDIIEDLREHRKAREGKEV